MRTNAKPCTWQNNPTWQHRLGTDQSWGTALQRGPVGHGEQSQQSAPAIMKVNCILSCSRSKKVSLYPTPMKQGLRALLYWGKQCRSTNSNKK